MQMSVEGFKNEVRNKQVPKPLTMLFQRPYDHIGDVSTQM